MTTSCNLGHGDRRGEKNPRAILDEAQVVEIRQRRADLGQTHTVLAKEFGVSRSTIRQAIAGDHWGHIPGSIPRPSFSFASLIRLPLPDAHSCISESVCAQHGHLTHFRCLPLTRGYFTLVGSEDYEWAMKLGRWNVIWNKAIHLKYARLSQLVDGRTTAKLMHREIMARVIGRELSRDEYVDHINGDGLNNLRSNLRIATSSENARNRRSRAGSSSVFRGVYAKKGKRICWGACIGNHHLGTYASEMDAARAYDRAALERYGAFARLNFPVTLEVQN